MIMIIHIVKQKQNDYTKGLLIHLYVRTTHEKHPENDPEFQTFPHALHFA